MRRRYLGRLRRARSAPRVLTPEQRRLWIKWRRRVLVLVNAAALALFLSILPPGARGSLLRSVLEQRTLIVLLLSFVLVVLSLLWAVGERLDAWTFLWFNLRGYRPRWLDRVMWWLTQLGNGGVVLGGSAVLYLVGQRRLAVELVLGTLSLWLVVELIKALTDRARPYVLLEDARVVGWREAGLSFPSGHTSQVFFLASFLMRVLEFTPFGAFALYAVAALVGLTRMYVGAHYPRDVLAGAMLGTVWGVLIVLIDIYFISIGI